MDAFLERGADRAARLYLPAVGLIGAVWISAAIFGVYIVVFFIGALLTGEGERWNDSLPMLYGRDELLATAAIGLHFITGGVLLGLGPIQLMESLRARWPGLHRVTGRVYVGAAMLAGAGGLVFIAVRGTIGGWPMDLGFSLYGILIVLTAVQTVRHARARRFDVHRAWGMRLFALAIGSWLYRMEYAFWFVTVGHAGHTPTFDGPFDVVMAFFFYLPNLVVVEAMLRVRRTGSGPVLRRVVGGVLLVATAFVAVATFEMTRIQWGPAIVDTLDRLLSR